MSVEKPSKFTSFVASLGLGVQDDTVILGLEPLHGLLLHKSVRESDSSDLSASVSHVHASPAQDDVEVHTVDADGGIVLDAQVDVFLDAEAEVAVVGEVLTTQFVFTDLGKKIKFVKRYSRHSVTSVTGLLLVR